MTTPRAASRPVAARAGFVAILVVSAVFMLLTAHPVGADGSPDIELTKDMAPEGLVADQIPVSLTVSNPGGTDGFNLTVSDVLPIGVSYVPGSASPAPQVLPQPDGTTVLIWANLSDALAGTDVELEYAISAGPGLDANDTITNSAGAYVQTDPRIVPEVDPDTGEISDFTGSATASDTTVLAPFQIIKSELSRENELLRGVHDHQTVYTLAIQNNFLNPTTDFSVVDYLPAQLEFLGCGGVDNSSAEEYPGAGVINPGNEPGLSNPCIAPSSVTTVTTDPDGAGPMPSGVYTRVEWDVATLATSLAPGALFEMDYIAAIPLQANVDTALINPTANLDNNTGPLTRDDRGITNYAIAEGTYDGQQMTDSDTGFVVAEDLSIHKSVDNPTFEQGDTPEFTLLIETSEYMTGSGPVVLTDTVPATLDITGATPAFDDPPGQVVNADGTITVTWTLPPFDTASSDLTVTLNTLVRESYRLSDGSDGAAVGSSDTHTNVTEISTDATVLSDDSGGTTEVPVDDRSEVSQSSGAPTAIKEVGRPTSPMTCGDGSSLAFDTTSAGGYRPGDRVCWRLTVSFPTALDTVDPVLTDFLPAGFEYESWLPGANSDLGASDLVFTDGGQRLDWELADIDAGAVTLEIVISSVITDPTAAASTDLSTNLLKFRYRNVDGSVFQLREDAEASISEAELELDKGVIALNAAPVAGAPADGVTVMEGDVVTYQIEVTNNGTADAFDASIRDTLPPGITCADIDLASITNGGICDAANDWIQWETTDDLDVDAGSSITLSYDLTVPVGTSASASLVNTAGIRTYGGETNTGDPFTYVPDDNIDPTLTPNTDPADDTSEIVTAEPVLRKARATELAEPGNRLDRDTAIGEIATWTVALDLPAGNTLYAGVLSDSISAENDLLAGTVTALLDGAPLPAGFSLTVDDAANSWEVTFPSPYSVPAGADSQLVVTFDAVVTDVASNVRDSRNRNLAQFDFENAAGDSRRERDAITIRIVEPNITLDKAHDDVDGVVVAGQALIYTLTVTNDDSVPLVSTAHETVVVDTVPVGLIVSEAPGDAAEDGDTIAPDGGVWDATARTITWNIATMAPGDSENLTYEAFTADPLLASAELKNTAVATTTSMPGDVPGERTSTSPHGDENGDGYLATADASITVPVLGLTKSAGPAIVTIGSTVEYTLTATIPGGVIAYDVTIIDDLPPGITFESLVSVTCAESGGACTPDLAVGDVDVIEGGGDAAFFFDDLLVAATDDRIVTIVYEAYVADVSDNISAVTLTNGATIAWNTSDLITDVPDDPPGVDSFDSASDPVSDDVQIAEPELVIDKAVSGQVGDDDWRRAKPGDVLTYTLTISSTGPGDAFNATVVDTPSDTTWAFTDTTVAAGVTNTDANPVGGLEWTIDGPIAGNVGTVVITYQLTVPPGFTSAEEVVGAAEQINVADISSYYAVDEDTRDANPDRDFRPYTDVRSDSVEVELDLASIGDLVWFDVNDDGVIDPGEPGLANVTVTVTYLGPDGTLGGGDDEVYTAVTGTNGDYLVNNLPAGQYLVEVDLADADIPAGMTPSYDLDTMTLAPDGSWSGTLGEDEDKTNVDFGFTGTGSIGDLVWLDLNANGAVDAVNGEVGLVGVDVTVTWLGPDGAVGGGDDVAYTTTTNAAGAYLVENLAGGAYTVEIDTADLPAGIDNVTDPDGGTDSISSLVLAAGAEDLDQDFGYAGTATIGDFIWLDQNGDGIADPGEPGLGGVAVQLTYFGPDGLPGGGDDISLMTMTAANGTYLFENLPAGSFEVAVIGALPSNVSNSADPDSPAPGDSVSVVTITEGEANLDQDFGYFAESVLGDRVWWDLNADGVQAAGEPGLNGVQVTATFLGADGALGGGDDVVFVTTTSGDGDYLFQDVPDGQYVVAVTGSVPTGFSVVYDEDSGPGSPDASTEVALADEHLTADFGYNGTSSIGDTVWYDADADGTLNPGDFGIEGVTVTLTWFGPDGAVGGGDDLQFTQMTGPGGGYLFDNLPAGEFSVEVDSSTLPPGLAETWDLDTGLASPDGVTPVTLGIDEDIDEVDFGYRGTGSIGDKVWFDRNSDGVTDTDEVGLPGVDVTVVWTGPGGPVTFTTTTDGNGLYLFPNMPAGDYVISVDPGTLPAGMTPTFDPNGGLDNTTTLALAAGEDNEVQDFGYAGLAAIGDAVYLDLDGNGTQDPGEPGIGGQTVEITWTSPSGPVVFSTVTGAGGDYLFEGLADGNYTATVIGGIVNDAVNTADPDGPGDSTSTLVLSGADDLDQDFGYQGTNSIGDLVWYDVDANGAFDGTDVPLPGVTVSVVWFGPDGVAGGGDDLALPDVVTGPTGLYLVPNLPDGSFSVTVTAGLPTGVDSPTFDADSGTVLPDAISAVTNLGPGAEPDADLEQDFGFTGSASVGDHLWLDVNADGVQDPGEPDLGGIDVTVISGGLDGILGTADDLVTVVTTNGDGDYLVTNLPPGPVAVSYDPADLSPGLVPATDLDGSEDATAALILGLGEDRTDVDFAVVGNAQLSGLVFEDDDGDGLPDSGEPGIGGVTLVITWDGPDGPVVFTVVTAPDGTWSLPQLPPGDYTVEVDETTVPSGLSATTPVDASVVLPPGGSGEVTTGYARPGSLLPFTGLKVGILVSLAIALIGVGAAFNMTARHRDKPRHV